MPALAIRLLIGLLLIIHGFAHYRITTAWGKREVAEAPLLSGMGLNAAAVQTFGNVLWVLSLLAFIVAGLVVMIQPGLWFAPTMFAALVSLLTMGLYWMPSAVAGALVDLAAVLALLVFRWPTAEMLGVH